MHFGRLDDFCVFAERDETIAAAVDFAKTLDADSPEGEFEIDGQRIKAKVEAYMTVPFEEKRFEAHRKYIDLQVILDGEEIMAVTPLCKCETLEAYDAPKDISWHDAAAFSTILARPGDAALFFPDDVHKPGCVLLKPSRVRKVVVKMAMK